MGRCPNCYPPEVKRTLLRASADNTDVTAIDFSSLSASSAFRVKNAPGPAEPPPRVGVNGKAQRPRPCCTAPAPPQETRNTSPQLLCVPTPPLGQQGSGVDFAARCQVDDECVEVAVHMLRTSHSSL